MKRCFTIVIALVLLLAVAVPVLAANSEFVPSISYKPDPEIVSVEGAIAVIRDADGKIVDYVDEGCLLITPLADAVDEETDIPEEIRELLTTVYEALVNGDMTIPYEKFEDEDLDAEDMSIRDLFDIRFICEEHKEMLEQEGYTLEIIFDLGVAKDDEIYTMTYDEEVEEGEEFGQWEPIVSTTNNGDGTVTCVFDTLCAVEFSIKK